MTEFVAGFVIMLTYICVWWMGNQAGFRRGWKAAVHEARLKLMTRDLNTKLMWTVGDIERRQRSLKLDTSDLFLAVAMGRADLL